MIKFNSKNIIAVISILFFSAFFIILILGNLSEKTPKISKGVNTITGEVEISAPEGTTFDLINISGQKINLSKYRGKPLVIDFWSSWCGPCIKEARVLSEGYKEWNFRGVEFVGIAVWDSKNSIKDFVENNDIQYEIVIDKDGFTAVNFGVIAVPEKFFVKSDGSFAFKINGPIDKESLDSYITRLIKEDKNEY